MENIIYFYFYDPLKIIANIKFEVWFCRKFYLKYFLKASVQDLPLVSTTVQMLVLYKCVTYKLSLFKFIFCP